MRFYQLAPGKGGSGIGLAVVKEVLAAVGGDVSIKDYHTNKGCVFEVKIPVSLPMIDEKREDEDDGKPVLLVVEDDDDLLKFVELILADEWVVKTTQDGEMGMEMAQKVLPDVILSDVMLPGKSGVELCTFIKQTELTKHIPLVLFSAKSSTESRLKGLNAGADAYLNKPFHPEELKLALKNVLLTAEKNRSVFKEGLQKKSTYRERLTSEHDFINECTSIILAQLEYSDFSVHDLANAMNVSRSQLHRKLHAMTGCSSTEFINTVRIEVAKDLLKEKKLNVTEVSYKVGFNSQSYFSKIFTEFVGESPSNFMQ